jgi:hypothetical protein
MSGSSGETGGRALSGGSGHFTGDGDIIGGSAPMAAPWSCVLHSGYWAQESWKRREPKLQSECSRMLYFNSFFHSVDHDFDCTHCHFFIWFDSSNLGEYQGVYSNLRF